ncbi:MAG: hypothetical protein KJ666_10915, partial [Bacteroidetes bacterium]|nr:hypothetical protein [Bacteroidota bacterium]
CPDNFKLYLVGITCGELDPFQRSIYRTIEFTLRRRWLSTKGEFTRRSRVLHNSGLVTLSETKSLKISKKRFFTSLRSVQNDKIV